MADKSVVALHSLKSGTKTINLPGNYKVKDLIHEKIISKGTRKIKFNLDALETHIFLIEH